MGELLGCPFCGSTSFIFLRVDSNNYALICQYTPSHGCGMRGPYGKSRKEAGSRWNTRVIDVAAIKEVVSRIRLTATPDDNILHSWADKLSKAIGDGV